MADCPCTIEAIDRECGRNTASMKPVLYASCPDQIASIGTATNHAVATITMRSAVVGPPAVAAGKFFEWGCSRRDIEFQSEQDEETGVWNTTASYFIPKQTAAKAAILNNLGEENNIFIAVDMNGAKRIVGAKDLPATIRVTETTTPRNGYNVRLSWQSGESPYFYTGSIAV
jgi:hypothetical protein